jgi:hypothetical protein
MSTVAHKYNTCCLFPGAVKVFGCADDDNTLVKLNVRSAIYTPVVDQSAPNDVVKHKVYDIMQNRSKIDSATSVATLRAMFV